MKEVCQKVAGEAVHRSDPLLRYGALWSAAEPPPSIDIHQPCIFKEKQPESVVPNGVTWNIREPF